MKEPERDLSLVNKIWESTPLAVVLPIAILVIWAIVQLIFDFVAKKSLFKKKKEEIPRLFATSLNEIQDCQRIFEISLRPEINENDPPEKAQSDKNIERASNLARNLEFSTSNLDTILQILGSTEELLSKNNSTDSSYSILGLRIKALNEKIASSENLFSKSNGGGVDPEKLQTCEKIDLKTYELLKTILRILESSLGKKVSYVDHERLLLIAKRVLTRHAEYSARVQTGKIAEWSQLSNFNPLYHFLSFFVLLISSVNWFFRYLFDTDGILVAFREYWYFKPSRRSNDMRRLLHLAWHCSVYIPILAITIVASLVLGIGREGYFFLCLASSAVSLEICVSVILDKVHHLQDLTRQTTRAIRQYEGIDAILGLRWIKYFQKRHLVERTGVAKAALVTIFSIFLFSIVLGIEVLTLKKHSLESDIVHKIQKELSNAKDHGSINLIPVSEAGQGLSKLNQEIAESNSVLLAIYNENFLLSVAGICSFLLFFISVYKLWVQTRYVLEDCDAMDRFETPEEAVTEYLAGIRHHNSTEYMNDNVD
jgi:hypothetical protein